jgi:hypothetical protein
VVLWAAAARDTAGHPPPGPLPPLPAHVDPTTAPVQITPLFGYQPQRLATLTWNEPIGPPAADTGGDGNDPDGRDDGAHYQLIAATWLLMGQTLTRTRTETAPRPARKRITRIDPALPTTVRCIDLRRVRTTGPGPDTTTTTGRAYHHRWVVTGHWRNQWYPSQQRHRPIWIAPHLAGPDDAPLLGGDRVHVLRR